MGRRRGVLQRSSPVPEGRRGGSFDGGHATPPLGPDQVQVVHQKLRERQERVSYRESLIEVFAGSLGGPPLL